MNHTYIDEQHVIDRYVRGTLPAEEAARFEEHYLSCQDCLDQLDLAEAMKRGFQRAAGQDAARVVVASRQLAFVAWLARLSRSRQASVLMMGLLVAVLLPWGLAERRMADRERELAQERSALEQEQSKGAGKLRAELEATQRELANQRAALESATQQLDKAREPQVNIPILGLNVERGGPGEGPPPGVHLPSSPGPIVLSLGIDDNEQASYQVVLRDARGREVWRGGDIKVQGGSLNLTFHSSKLAPGDYKLVVESHAPGRKPVLAGRFVFRVLPPG